MRQKGDFRPIRCLRTFPTSARLKQVALGAARVLSAALEPHRIARKTNLFDLITEDDRESEKAVISTLNRLPGP
jgi:hypothetical protein